MEYSPVMLGRKFETNIELCDLFIELCVCYPSRKQTANISKLVVRRRSFPFGKAFSRAKMLVAGRV